MHTILIVEDDKALAEGLTRALTSAQQSVKSCAGIKAAKTELSEKNYSLIILDINLPDGNGFDLLNFIKSKYDTPVIILSANDMESDIVSGIELGADDYITKPFSLAILRARVNAIFRKTASDKESASQHKRDCYTQDGYVFDFKKIEFYHDGKLIDLSRTEQKLLRILTENAGITLTRGRLMDFVWSDGSEFVDENALSVVVKRLRDKLSAQAYIKTVYGIGYIWNNNDKTTPQSQSHPHSQSHSHKKETL